jgi:hypothetical protein
MGIDKDVALSIKIGADDTELAAVFGDIKKKADDVAKDSGKSFDGFAKNLDGSMKAVADSTKILHERIKEIGKGVAFGIVAQQFSNLKGVINDTAASALGAGASGAAMGATFAGPWGAAIGGAIGLAKGLVGGLLDSEAAAEAARKKIEEQGRAYWAQIDAAKRAQEIAGYLASAQAELAEAEKQATEAAAEHNKALQEQPDAYRHAADRARAYHDALVDIDYELRKRLELEGRLAAVHDVDTNAGQTEDEANAIDRSRKLRDAEIDKYAATKSYGALYKELQGAEDSRADRMRDLEGILGDVNASEAIRSKALKEYNDLATQATKKTVELAKATKELAVDTPMLAQARANIAYNESIQDKWLGPQQNIGQSLLNALGGAAGGALGGIGGGELGLSGGIDQVTESVKNLVHAAQPEGPTLLQRLGLDDPQPWDMAVATAQAFGTAWETSLKSFGEGSMSAATIFKKGLGAVVGGIGDKLAAMGAAELVEGTAMAFTLNPLAAGHFAAGAVLSAGAVAAYAAASELNGGGGGANSAAAKPSASGGGSSAGSGRDANGVVDSRGASSSGPDRYVFINYDDAYSDASPRVREQQVRKKMGKVLGSIGGQGWSND